MTLPIAIQLATLLAAASPTRMSDGLGPAVHDIVAGVKLAAQPGFRLDEDLAVAVRVDRRAPRGDLGRLVLGLVMGEVERVGARSVLDLGATFDASLGDIDRQARAAGAEWLLLTTVERLDPTTLELRTELRSIDRGLWAPIPKPSQAAIHAFAAKAIRVQAGIETLVDPPVVAETDGEPSTVGTVPGTVLALAMCDLDGRAGDEIIALTPGHVLIYTRDRGRWAVAVRYGLERLLRSATPAREPIGGLLCGDLDGDDAADIAFGHSGLKHGQIAVFAPDTRTLRIRRTVEGVPLASLGPRAIVFADVHEGTARWSPRVQVGSFDRRRPVELEQPFLDATAQLDKWAIVTAAYEVVWLDPSGKLLDKIGHSGVGISALGRDQIAGTQHARGPTDRVAVLGRETKPATVIDTRGLVFATAAGRKSDRSATLIVAVQRRDDRTEIIEVGLGARR